MEQSWIKDIQINSFLEENRKAANNEITVMISEEAKETGESFFLWARMEERNGKEVDAIFPLPLEEELSFCMRVSDPVLWNAENAYCYRIVIEIRDSGQQVLETQIHYAAYYKWEVINGDNCLNGKRVPFRSRKLPEELRSESLIEAYLRSMKHDFCNTLLIESEQRSEFLTRKCLEYGIYLVAPGAHLDCGKIRAELEQNPQGAYYEVNPDFTLEVIKDGVLIENRCVFANVSEYQLVFEVRKGEQTVQKGKIHVDVPAGASKYLNLPYMELREVGEFLYRVSLHLEEGVLWEEAGYEIANGENHIANLFF